MSPNGEVVLGVDIGTTSTKVIAFDVNGHAHSNHQVSYSLDEPLPGYAEQDPETIVSAVRDTLRLVAAGCNRPIAAISFSAAMHSLIGLDEDLRPLTPSVTWADLRASAQAERLHDAPIGIELQRRTGTPMHPMAPLPKLIWFRETQPRLFERVRHWVGIKDYVLWRLCGQLVTDYSLASGTGMMDLSRLTWDPAALELAGVVPDQLPRLVATGHVLDGLTGDTGPRTGLPADTPVVVGAGDGPLANLGLGAVTPGVAACSIGTSAALRVIVDRPGVDPHGGAFCYALTDHRWAVGGAINNGGIVLEWAGEALAPDLPGPAALLSAAATAPPGADGLIMLPYLLSERAPHWSPTPRGAYVGLTREHGRAHLVRAALEGVCQQLALVLASMRAAGKQVDEIRATGGFARSPLWRQMLTDTLGMPIGFPADVQGSCFGAALLGMQAVGLVTSVDVAADLVRIVDVVEPDPAAMATYAAMRPVFAQLYDALTPAFRALRHPTAP